MRRCCLTWPGEIWLNLASSGPALVDLVWLDLMDVDLDLEHKLNVVVITLRNVVWWPTFVVAKLLVCLWRDFKCGVKNTIAIGQGAVVELHGPNWN